MFNEPVNSQIIKSLQAEFPLVERPFEQIGRTLGLSGTEVISIISGLKAEGVIREISGVVNPRSLGYSTTLIAIKASESHLPGCIEIINNHPRISHAYVRDHHFNLWITLAEKKDLIETEIKALERKCPSTVFISMPSIKVYKLKPISAYSDSSLPVHPRQNNPKEALDKVEEKVLKIVQQDLPIIPSPFDVPARSLGLTVNHMLDIIGQLLNKGVLRRYGANINHYRMGYLFNVMTCFKVDRRDADRFGDYLAGFKQVSHCYLRQSHSLFPYNLFAMVHNKNAEEFDSFLQQISAQIDTNEYIALKSLSEIKKKRAYYTT